MIVVIIVILIIMIYRVTQSKTGFDFHCSLIFKDYTFHLSSFLHYQCFSLESHLFSPAVLVGCRDEGVN